MTECRIKAFRHSSTYYRRVIRRLSSQRRKGNKYFFQLYAIFINFSFFTVSNVLHKNLNQIVSSSQRIASEQLLNQEENGINSRNKIYVLLLICNFLQKCKTQIPIPQMET